MEKQQIVVIHGGTVFPNRSTYIKYLNKQIITIESLKKENRWTTKLAGELGTGLFDVVCPEMPNRHCANWCEWEIMFKKIISITSQNTLFIGHSLGGVFLTKFALLNLNWYPKGLVLVASPFNDKELYDFSLEAVHKKRLHIQVRALFGQNDPIIPITHANKYNKLGVSTSIIDCKGHLQGEDVLPHLLQIIIGW